MTVILPGRDRVPRFDPRMLSGLLMRFQADKDASASLWSDKSGAGNNATQATLAQRPAFSSTAFNGRPGLTFDGSNDNMVLADSVTGAKTIGLSLRQTSTPGASTLRSLIKLKHGVTWSEILFVNFTNYREITFICEFGTTQVGARGAATTFDTNPHTVIMAYNGGSNMSNASYAVYLDGVALTVVASSSLNSSATAVGSIGGRATVSGFEIYPAPVNYFRALVYQGAKSSAEAALMHDWLRRGYQ